MRRLVPVVLALTLSVSATTAAQEIPAPQKWTNVEWYGVVTWYFSDGEEALALWTEHFMSVVDEVYPENTCLFFATGEPQLTCYGAMTDGISGMEWMVTEKDVEFMTRFAEQEGEATEELYGRWMEATSKYTFEIARAHTGGM